MKNSAYLHPASPAASALAAAQDVEATPSSRVLIAIELIAKHGPLTHRSFGTALGLSKASTARMVGTLRAAGWVRLRHGGRMIELDPRLDDLFAQAHFGDAEFVEVVSEMGAASEIHSVHIDLFSPNRRGELVFRETSRRMTANAPIPEATEEILLLAIRAAMSHTQLERHLMQIASDMDVESARNVTGPAARRRIQQFPGHAWSADGRVLAISVRGRVGSAAVLRLTAKTSVARPQLLANAYSHLAMALDGKVESFGHGLQTLDLP